VRCLAGGNEQNLLQAELRRGLAGQDEMADVRRIEGSSQNPYRGDGELS
jgi:hypothetical protein